MNLAEALELFDPRLADFTPEGLKPKPYPIPVDVLRDALLVFLRKVADRARREGKGAGNRYASMEELLLEEAEPVPGSLETTGLSPMAPGLCFDNAFAVSQANPFMEYYEGYALMDGAAEPFHHAWLVNRGVIHDPTWATLVQHKRVVEPGRLWTGAVVYLGLTIERGAHRRWAERTLYPNLLSLFDEDIPRVLEHGRAAWGETGG